PRSVPHVRTPRTRLRQSARDDRERLADERKAMLLLGLALPRRVRDPLALEVDVGPARAEELPLACAVLARGGEDVPQVRRPPFRELAAVLRRHVETAMLWFFEPRDVWQAGELPGLPGEAEPAAELVAVAVDRRAAHAAALPPLL